MSASQYRRSCDELGLCQGRATPCANCVHPFAPGAITHHTHPQRRALVRAFKRTAALMGAAIVIGLLAGLVFGAVTP